MTRVEYHPHFASQYEQLCEDTDATEVAGEVTQLIDALERFGHDIEGELPEDVSHPLVTSTLDTYVLRRTPPTRYTPYANSPPVLRIPYVWFFDTRAKKELAVVMLMGDKTELGHLWYPAQVQLIESKLAPEWSQANPDHRPAPRRR